MGNLSVTKEKNIIDCSQAFLEKSGSINEINKTFPYKVCTIQDLYDTTSLKNGVNIDLAASLIYKSKNMRIILPHNKDFENLFTQFCDSLKRLGIYAKILSLENDIELEKIDIVLVLNSDLNFEYYKNLLNDRSTKKLKIINVLSEKDRNKKDIFGINLYHLDSFNLDKNLCIEILLNSLYFGLLVKFNKQ